MATPTTAGTAIDEMHIGVASSEFRRWRINTELYELPRYKVLDGTPRADLLAVWQSESAPPHATVLAVETRNRSLPRELDDMSFARASGGNYQH
ncbi:hypothetical protein O9K51_05478 [Purpureocillium lavendulum]|uniref:Uncharacterized protein n=1 Tax=Purpureocillium lavendulum TaxID=1247861 RepID=A0AB34FRJ7_9HYPO|nr:hypothetical protein O9K51_05478 [Purpureocillium lavendulum]